MSISRLNSIFIKNQPFTTEEAARLLSLTLKQTSRILYKYNKQGHLYKLKKGFYLPVTHKGLTAEESFSDPWVIVPIIFPGSYIGGWSAANYWGLTEQLFRTTSLLTIRPVHHKQINIGRFDYALFSNSCGDIGLESIWREQVQVLISDSHRTVIDILNNPKCSGGIQQTIDCLKIYFEEHYNEETLISYMKHVKSGVFFKRLGYIVERLFGSEHALCRISKDRITKGYSVIDSSLDCNKLITHWHLYISEDIVI
jgi:predicted transcriptional regulator of viral defense system